MSKWPAVILAIACGACSLKGRGNDGGAPPPPRDGGTDAAPAVEDAPPAGEDAAPIVDDAGAVGEDAGRSSRAPRPVPDLTGKTAAEAEAMLRAAGFAFDHLEITAYACAEGDDKKMLPKETVCDQHPSPGVMGGPRLISVTVTIQHDTYERGAVGSPNEWRRMPDLVGKPLDVARTLLNRAGLPLADQFEVIDDTADGCKHGHVCHTEPAAKGRKVLARKGRIYVKR